MCHCSENEIGSRLLTRNSRKIAACYLKTFDPQKDSCKLIFTAIRFAKELNTINTRWTPFNLPHSVRTKTKLTREKNLIINAIIVKMRTSVQEETRSLGETFLRLLCSKCTYLALDFTWDGRRSTFRWCCLRTVEIITERSTNTTLTTFSCAIKLNNWVPGNLPYHQVNTESSTSLNLKLANELPASSTKAAPKRHSR